MYYIKKKKKIINLPGEELKRLAIVGEEPLWGEVIAECSIDELFCDTDWDAVEGDFNKLVNNGEVGVGLVNADSSGTSTLSGSLRGLSASLLGSDILDALLMFISREPGFQARSNSIFRSSLSFNHFLWASFSNSFFFFSLQHIKTK